MILKQFKENYKEVIKIEILSNLLIRSTSILFRFLFQIIIINYISTYEYGEYAVFYSTNLLLVFIYGLEFYTFSSRRIIGTNINSIFIQNQLFFQILLYLITIPIIISLIYFYQLFSKSLIYFFLIYLFFELISNELFKFLIALEKSIIGNILFLIRNGLPSIVIVIYTWMYKKIHFEEILLIFIFFSACSTLYGLLNIPLFTKHFKIKKIWFFYGIKSSFKYYLSGILFLILAYANIYIVKYYCGVVEVGILSYFKSFLSITQAIIYNGITIFYLPKLVFSAKNHKYKEQKKYYYVAKKLTYIFTTISIIIAVTANYFFNIFTSKKEFYFNFDVMIILALGQFFYSISSVYNLLLFSNNKDLLILNMNILVIIINIMFGILLTIKYGLLGMSIAQLISYLLLFILSVIFSKEVINKLNE